MTPAAEKLAYLASAAASAVTGFAWPTIDPISIPSRVLHAAGIEIGVVAYLAGIWFAVAGGFIAMAAVPPDSRMTKWWTLLAAGMIGTLTAILHPHVPVVGTLPVQAVMGMAGLGSRKAVNRIQNLDFSLPWKGASK